MEIFTESLCDETTEIDEDYYFTIHIPKYMSNFISKYMYTRQDSIIPFYVIPK